MVPLLLLLIEPIVSVTVSQAVMPASARVTVTVACSVMVWVTMVMSETSRMARAAVLGPSPRAAPLTAAAVIPKWATVAAAARMVLKIILILDFFRQSVSEGVDG